jgi:competence protein ComEA
MFRILASLIIAAFASFAAIAAQAAVDVNKANQAELESVKGIGPGLSTKILDARKTGAFKDWGDLVDRVSGVGPGNATRFSQAGLTVGNTTYVAVAAADKPAAKTKASASKGDAAPAVKSQPATATPAR